MEPALERKTFYSYGSHYQATSDFFAPKSLGELREALAFARRAKRTLSFSGSGLSFDNQYMSDDLIVSLKNLRSIRVLPEERAVEVGPGAKWGDIVKEAFKHNLLPYILITSTQPTAGGTLSAHTNSIFTPCCGKEGKHVIEFDLMLVDGSIVTCSRDENRDLFYGAIAGLGSLGAFTRIKYRLLDLKGPAAFKIAAVDYDDLSSLETRFRTEPGADIDDVTNVWSESSFIFFEGELPRLTIYKRKFVPLDKASSHFSLQLYLSIFTIALVRFAPHTVNMILSRDRRKKGRNRLAFRGTQSLFYGAFYMEPDYLLHRILRLAGYRTRLFQNSYFIPLRGDQVTRFTQRTADLMRKHRLSSSMFDIMYIPKDEPFLLSASKDEHGFYINTTFLDTARTDDVMACYAELNGLCAEMGGKLNLVKNAFIEPALLEAMFEPSLKELAALKRRVDPDFTLNSLFLRQKFPSYFGR